MKYLKSFDMFESLNASQRDWVERTFASLTTEQKLGQIVCEDSGAFSRVPNPQDWLAKYPVGSMYLGAEVIDPNAIALAAVKQITSKVDASVHIPMLYCGDFEDGVGSAIGGYSTMPRIMGLSATFDPGLAYEYGRIIAEESRSLNIRWAFGPVSDLNLNRENPIVNARCAGVDPDHSLSILKGIVKGMQDHGCAACPKHFPGDGTDSRNQHLVTSLNLLSREDWDRFHGRVFKELIDAGALSIMIGHMGFPAYEPVDEKKGIFRPATASKRMMSDLLRGELGFKGIILSDALSMCGFKSWGDYEERMIDSFNGGMDVFLWPETEKFFELMLPALRDGRASMDRLDASARRVLIFKALLGLSEESKPVDAESIPDMLKRNNEIAGRMAEKSITLLRNKKNHLPLKLEKGAKILMLVVPNMPVQKSKLVPFYNMFRARGFDVTYGGFSDYHPTASVVEHFDAVFLLCNGQPHYHDVRAFDTTVWAFMENHKIQRRIIISFGTPYYLYEVASADTYINAYSENLVTQQAVFKAIFGEIPFLGKSPVSVPHCFDLGDGILLKN
jgi:beta-N-acetylhexosaminidase